MRNFLPELIYNKYKENFFSGNFNATTMFIDISGFTPLTEELMKQGKEGVEVLGEILNNIFKQLIVSIYEGGGFISGVEGDAVISVFPDENPIAACLSALETMEILNKNKLQNTKFGNFEFSLKIGLSYGNVEWGIVGTETHKTYYFKGEAIIGCTISESYSDKMQITIDNKLYDKAKDNLSVKEISDGYFNLLEVKKAISDKKATIEKTTIEKIEMTKAITQLFLPKELVEHKEIGEFRNIVPVFISFKGFDEYSELNAFSKYLLEKMAEYGGFLDNLRFSDKGSHCLVLFGVPISYEDNIIRAINFINSLREKYKQNIRFGITYGLAFTGVIGTYYRSAYITPGNIVNLSARYMTKADWGEVWLSDEIQKQVTDLYKTQDLGKLIFKGKSEAIQTFSLLEKKQKLSSVLFKGKTIGRETELDKLREYIEPIYDKKFAGIIYIYGEAGIGKSRIVWELSETIKQKVKSYTLQSDNILKKSVNPFVYFLNNYFKQSQAKNPNEKKQIFEQVFNELIGTLKSVDDERKEPIVKELERTKSIFGALLGIYWEGSLYEELEPKLRFENTLYALKDFFKGLSLINPILILLEDLHWIDDDSQKAFQTLTRNIDAFPIVVIASSRFNDDGSKPVLKVDEEVTQKEISIDTLTHNSTKELINYQLQYISDESLTRFIEDKTEGNPFFTQQFCLYLVENNVLELKNNKYILKKSDIEIPSRISDIIIARIDRLSKELKDAVQIASVLGREFEVKVLQSLINLYRSAIKDEKFKSLLEDGEDEKVWNTLTELKYIFKHALLQETVYEMQLKQRLRELHKLAGETIENIYKDEKPYYSELAYHYENAEEIEKAKEYLEKAGDYARDNYERNTALKFYMKLLKYINDEEKEIKINDEIGSIYYFTGRRKESEKILKRNIDMAKKTKNKYLITGAKLSYGNFLFNIGTDFNEIYSIFEEVFELSKTLTNKKIMANCLKMIGKLFERTGDLDIALKNVNMAIDIANEINRKEIISSSFIIKGDIYRKRGNYDKAIEYYNKSLRINKEISNKYGEIVVYQQIAIIHRQKGNYNKSIQLLQKDLKILEEIGSKTGKEVVYNSLGGTYFFIGNYSNALKYYNKSVEICNELGHYQYGFNSSLSNIGLIYSLKGNYDAALNYFNTILKSKYIGSDKTFISLIIGNIAYATSKKGNYDAALSKYEEAIRMFKEVKEKFNLVYYLYNYALLLFQINRIEEATELNNEALQVSQQIKRPDIIFNSKVLNEKLIALKDKQSAINNLNSMLSEYTKDEEVASLNYELFKLTNNNEQKSKSIELYKKLYEKTPKIEYKDRFEELETDFEKI